MINTDNTMEVYCKSGMKREQLQDRLSRDISGIEVQLSIKDTMDQIKANWIQDIQVVHPPLDAKGKFHVEVPFDYATSRPYHLECCRLINELAGNEGRTVRYVLHIKQAKEDLIYRGEYDRLIEDLRQYARDYSNIIFCIENTIMYTEPYYMIEIVRDIDMPNVTSCIDICHLQYSLYISRLMKGIHTEVAGLETVLSIDEMFRRCTNNCGLIHLCKCGTDPRWPYGLGNNHGVHFDPHDATDLAELSGILSVYHKYGYDCPLTLEVKERDYGSAINYSLCRDALTMVEVA